MKEIFPDPMQLKKIEMWGGEPSYGLPRAYETIRQALDYYPQLTEFMMSTNLTTPTFLNDFYGFLDLFKAHPSRNFFFSLQLSLDGPTYINDVNRGKGTTEKFSTNFLKLITTIGDKLKEIPNVKISAHFKPTWDSSSFKLLQTKKSLIEYYQFFEIYKDLSEQYVESMTGQWVLDLPNPNTACPSPHTAEDGKLFANICKMLLEILEENDEKHYFKYPRNIMPFRSSRPYNKDEVGFYGYCTNCGTGNVIVGLLPNHKLSACHNGFVDLLTDYKIKSEAQKDQVNRTIDFKIFSDEGIDNIQIYDLDRYALYEQQMNCYNPNAKFNIVELASLIQLYAATNQIDSKYQDKEKAVNAAIFIVRRTSNCIRDNLGVTGSRFLNPPGFIKLFLNGAKEYIENADKWH